VYYWLHTNGTLVSIHGGQLRAYLLYDWALRDDRRPSIQPFGYQQFANLYNRHPNTTEEWTILDNAGAVRVSNTPITHSWFHVEDLDLVDIQSLVPAECTLDDEKAGLLNEMLWGAAQWNAANHRSAQHRRAQRKQTYEELEDGRENRRRHMPTQPAAPIMVLSPNMETPSPATIVNPTVTANPSEMTAAIPTEKEANKPDDNDELISLGDEFEPREPMDIDGPSERTPSTSSSNPSITASETDLLAINTTALSSPSAIPIPSTSAPVISTSTSVSDLHFRKNTRSHK
jgi:hypothetical protein